MKSAFFHYVSEDEILDEMTIYLDPLKTEPRYKPGIYGVAASIGRLEYEIYRSDWQTLSSVLGDMALCLNINCHDVLDGDRFPSWGLQVLFRQLKVAVVATDLKSTRLVLRRMLELAGMLEQAGPLKP